MHKKSKVAMKACAKCQTVKDLCAFGRDSSRPDGRYSYCKDCRRKPNKVEVEISELASKGLKKCSLCLRVKPFNAYEQDASKRLGITSRCKKCKRDERRRKAVDWHKNKKYMRRLYEQGQSKCYKCGEVKEFSKFLSSKTRQSGVLNLCLDCNNKIRREYNRKRSKASRDYIRWEVFEDDDFTCYLCEDVLDPRTPANHPKSLTIDHVVPVAKGGPDERDNVRTACLDCNRKKNDLSLEEFFHRRDSLSKDFSGTIMS